MTLPWASVLVAFRPDSTQTTNYKSGIVSCETEYHFNFLVDPQNPSNFSDIACTSKVKRGKNYEKKRKRKKASDEGFGWYVTGRP